MNINLGVSIDEKTFSKLTAKQQRVALFRTINKGNRFHNFLQYSWLSVLTGYLGLFKTELFGI